MFLVVRDQFISYLTQVYAPGAYAGQGFCLRSFGLFDDFWWNPRSLGCISLPATASRKPTANAWKGSCAMSTRCRLLCAYANTHAAYAACVAPYPQGFTSLWHSFAVLLNLFFSASTLNKKNIKTKNNKALDSTQLGFLVHLLLAPSCSNGQENSR